MICTKIWCYLWVNSVRIELNWCWRIACLVCGNPHTWCLKFYKCGSSIRAKEKHRRKETEFFQNLEGCMEDNIFWYFAFLKIFLLWFYTWYDSVLGPLNMETYSFGGEAFLYYLFNFLYLCFLLCSLFLKHLLFRCGSTQFIFKISYIYSLNFNHLSLVLPLGIFLTLSSTISYGF